MASPGLELERGGTCGMRCPWLQAPPRPRGSGGVPALPRGPGALHTPAWPRCSTRCTAPPTLEGAPSGGAGPARHRVALIFIERAQ